VEEHRFRSRSLSRRGNSERLLDIRTSNGEICDEDEDGDGENESGGTVSKFDPAEVMGLAYVVGEGRAQRARNDVGHPEGSDAVQAEALPRQGGEQDDHAEENA